MLALAAWAKEKGFRKKGGTFNRVTADGLTHVINVQKGQSSLQGQFTLNLGIYVPEVARTEPWNVAKDFVTETSCCIRRRLSGAWWKTDDPAAIPDVLTRLERDGLPFLEQFGSRDAILRELASPELRENMNGNMQLVRAIILAERGELAAVKTLLTNEAIGHANHPALANIRSLAEQLGIPLDP
jgi:hypothetical protein